MSEPAIDRLIRLLAQAQDIAARKRMRVHLRKRILQAMSAARNVYCYADKALVPGEGCAIQSDADADLITALRNVAPALLEAAKQNERRGELLRRVLGHVIPSTLRDDIAKELKP